MKEGTKILSKMKFYGAAITSYYVITGIRFFEHEESALKSTYVRTSLN